MEELRETIAVYGAGTIGSAQALLVTGNGIPCRLIGHSEAGLERCRRTIEQSWDDLIRRGAAIEENKAAAMRLLTITNDPKELAGCTFVFEAVAEVLESKKAVMEAIAEYAEPGVITASCTSSIDAEDLAEVTADPEHFIIAHPFQPVHLQPLVEMVPCSRTSAETIERTRRVLERLRREVVFLKKSVPGFLINRFAQALFREAIDLMEKDVASAADIDRAVKYAVGKRYASIGLLEYFDAVGFGLEKQIAENVYPDLCDTKEIQKTVLDGIAAGKTGKAAGQGLFSWDKDAENSYRERLQEPFAGETAKWTLPE